MYISRENKIWVRAYTKIMCVYKNQVCVCIYIDREMKFGYASGDEAIGYFVFREKK